MREGVIVGCNQGQEWLLKWWWDHYSRHNSYPVAFADFGMSSGAIEWCKQKGIYLPPLPTIVLQEVSLENRQSWERLYGEGIWNFREVWFKKPSALLQTPFPISAWIDLDCKIRGDLKPLFANLLDKIEIALSREAGNVLNYNAGVIVFQKNAPIIHQWNHLIQKENRLFAGDQNALKHAILNYKPKLIELHKKFNWGRNLGPNDEALIYHYTGGLGKFMIYEELS